MKSKDPQAMINNLAKSNPKMMQALEISKALQQNGGTKKEMVMKACKQSGTDYSQVEKVLKSFGINL